eukprot:IDg5258t1
MLLVLTAPAGESNELLLHSRHSKKPRRERDDGRVDGADCYSSISIKFAIRGRHLCKEGFLAITQISERTLYRHAADVTTESTVQPYTTSRALGRQGKKSVQTIICLAFLSHHGDQFGLPSPRGTDFSETGVVRFLPSGQTKKDIYKIYETKWSCLVAASLCPSENDTGTKEKPTAPLSYFAFLKVWRTHLPVLRISAGGTDYCDTCTKLKHALKIVQISQTQLELSNRLSLHREEANTVFSFYKRMQREATELPTGAKLHLVFDFAEKVLLPSMKEQPGNLHFITGLRFDIFGVSTSNLNCNFIFGLPEGFWPNGKSANEVLSMLSYVLQLHRRQQNFKTLLLHADNCAGQNKNRFVIWYMCLLVMCGHHECVSYIFLVAGHTKNICDGAFGHVKRLYRASNVYTPFQMMNVIERSAKTSRCIPSTAVDWRIWKTVLERYFTVPSALQVSKYHSFTFRQENLGHVYVKELSCSSTEKCFTLLKRGLDPIDVANCVMKEIRDASTRATWPDLCDVPSKKEGNRKAYLKKFVVDKYFIDDK